MWPNIVDIGSVLDQQKSVFIFIRDRFLLIKGWPIDILCETIPRADSSKIHVIAQHVKAMTWKYRIEINIKYLISMTNRPICNALICTGCIRLIRKSHFGKISCLSDSTFQCVSLWLLDFIFVLFLDVKWLQNFKYYLTWYLTTFQYLQCCIILSFVLWFCVPKPLQTIKHYFKRRNTSIMTSPYQCKNTLHRAKHCNNTSRLKIPGIQTLNGTKDQEG